MYYGGIFLLSASTLLLEVALLRIFSIFLWYHFAYMVVSIAFLGFGASGSVIMLSKDLKEKFLIFLGPLLFGISVPLSYLVSRAVPFDPIKLAWDAGQVLYITIYYIVLAVPFLFSGLTIAIALSRIRSTDTGKLYAADLVGAGSGPVLALVLFPVLEGKGVILISSIGGFLSSLLLLISSRRGDLKYFFLPVLGILSVLGLFILNPSFMEIRISPYKDLPFALKFEGAELVETRWNSFSRVDLIESPAVRFAPGLSLKYTGPLPKQKGVTVDGDGLTAVTEYSEDKKYFFLDYLPTALPYKLLESRGRGGSGGRGGRGAGVFLIEPGGGLPIMEALHHGFMDIKGAEDNPLVADLAETEFSGHIYKRAEIKTGEGRAVLRGSDERFDLIHIGITTQNAASSGLHGLTEEYRFTRDAFIDYYTHLEEEGYLAVTRYLLPPPREELKLVRTVISALEAIGKEDPGSRVVVYRTLETFSIILKKGVFDERETGLIKDFLKERRFDIVYYNGISPLEANIFNRFPEPIYYNLVSPLFDEGKGAEFIKRYPFNIEPSTDESPFFYHFFKIGKIKEVLESVGWKWQILLEGGYLLPIVFLQALFASVVLIILPVFWKDEYTGARAGKGAILVLVYFFLLGTGFMFIEISLIQRFILFLDHPEYSFSVVISVLLISSGAGSLLSERLKLRGGFTRALAAVFVLAVLYSLLLPALIKSFLGLDILSRASLTALFIAPMGVLMGMPFPLGMRYLKSGGGQGGGGGGKGLSAFIPWAWAVNGCASVLGGILSAMAAMVVGFSGVLLLAGICYLGALIIILLAQTSLK